MIIPCPAWRDASFTVILDAIRVLFEDFCSRLLNYLIDTVEHLIITVVLYILLCIFLYICMVRWKLFTFNRDIRNFKRVLIVIAHPDDECMFFGPTILNYTKKEKCVVYLMCLTTGRNYGMNSIRKRELYESCRMLGIKEGNILVHSHSLLPDAMDVRWPTDLVANLILYHIDSLSITAVITFDRHGVSGHNNHTCIYYSVANLILDGRLPKCCGVYVLETTNVIRKYWLLLDMPLSLVLSRFRYMGTFKDRRLIHDAMRKHKSQLVWFRRLYIIFSRYMLMNTLQQMNLVDIELDLAIDD